MSLDRHGAPGDVLLAFPSAHFLPTIVSAERLGSIPHHENVGPWPWIEGESSSSCGSSRRNVSGSSRLDRNSRRRSKLRSDPPSQRYSSRGASDSDRSSSSSSTLAFAEAEEEEEIHAHGATISRRSLLPYAYTSTSLSWYSDEGSSPSRYQAQSRSTSHRNRKSKTQTSAEPLASRADVASILTCARNDSWSTKRISQNNLHPMCPLDPSDSTKRGHSAAAMVPIAVASGGAGYGYGGGGGPNGGDGSNIGGGGGSNNNDSGDYWYSGGDARANGLGGGRNGSGGGGGEGGGDGDDGPSPPPKGNGSMNEGEKARRANPLVDLIETETAYVTELGMIIKKVASAWSKNNFPPAELDTMFRNVESVYRLNRGFLKSLKEIGPNPSSPKALGDLLMRWIDDLEAPYARYCDNFFSDFDNWPGVQSNNRLAGLLAEISKPPADGSPPIFSDKRRIQEDGWTMDGLFALPQIRLKYYKKLYARLLKSTQPGRSDHKLLVGANEKLDGLLEKAKQRIAVSILDGPIMPSGSGARESAASSAADTSATGDNSVDRTSSATSHSLGKDSAGTNSPLKPGMPTREPMRENTLPPPLQLAGLGSTASSRSPSPMINAPLPPRLPETIRATSPIALPMHNTSPLPLPSSAHVSSSESFAEVAARLQSQLDTSRTLDIFTMTPKACQLQINRADLPFKRELRRDADVVINFTPRATGREMTVRRAHIFLLTDLFLVCERMTPGEKASRNGPGEFWLLFPPLAGKHLKISDPSGMGNVLSILIMKKETLMVNFDSRQSKELWAADFEACQQFAVTRDPRAKLPMQAQPNSALPQLSTGPDLHNSLPPAPPLSPLFTAIGSTGSGSIASPSIAVTPSGDDRTASVMSGSSLPGADLTREGSFNSVASFPKVASAGGSVSPSGPSFTAGGPPPPRPGPYHTQNPQGFPGAPPVSTGPGSGMGPGTAMSGSPGTRPPSDATSPTSRPQMFNGRPPFRPGMNGSPTYGPVRPGMPMMNSNSPPYGPVRPGNSQMNGPPQTNGPPQMNGRPPQNMNRPPQFGRSGPQGRGPAPGQMPFPGAPGMPPHGRPPSLRSPSVPDLRGSAKDQRRGTTGSDGDVQARSRSISTEGGPPKMPSQMLKDGNIQQEQYSPPSSPKMRSQKQTSTVTAQMRCKLFLKQNHAQWKSLGNARLKVYDLMPSRDKQLVVENDKKTLISTIVLTDGVERVARTGVAVELSDAGSRTGIVYMLQLRSPESALGLFETMISNSDRTAAGALSY